MKNAAVIGAGTIGLSWTALFAHHGLTVRVTDPRPDLAEAVADALAQFAPHLGTTAEDLASRVSIATDVTEAVRDADVVQENGPENVEFKKDLFAQLVEEAPDARAAAQLVERHPVHGVHRRDRRERGSSSDTRSTRRT